MKVVIVVGMVTVVVMIIATIFQGAVMCSMTGRNSLKLNNSMR